MEDIWGYWWMIYGDIDIVKHQWHIKNLQKWQNCASLICRNPPTSRWKSHWPKWCYSWIYSLQISTAYQIVPNSVKVKWSQNLARHNIKIPQTIPDFSKKTVLWFWGFCQQIQGPNFPRPDLRAGAWPRWSVADPCWPEVLGERLQRGATGKGTGG